MSYVQIALLPVPIDKREAYLASARAMAVIFREHGAQVNEDYWGIDLPDGERTDFKRAVAAQENETVVVGMMIWPSKAAADEAMAAVEQDPRMAEIDMPFDGRRMIFGGFEAMGLDPT